MTALIITEWKPTDPRSPGWLSFRALESVLANDNVDGVVPADMYNRAKFSALRELFAMNFTFTQSHAGISRYARIQGTDRLYTVVAFDTPESAKAYQNALATASYSSIYEQVRDDFLELVKVQMTIHPIVVVDKMMTSEEIDQLTELDLIAALTGS